MSEIITNTTGLILDTQAERAMKNNTKLKNYKESRQKRINAPTPEIEVLHSTVLVRAVQPDIAESKSGIIINQYDISDSHALMLEAMTDNVDDIQEILLIGDYVEKTENNKILPGKYAKIDFNRFKTIKAGHNVGHTDVIYQVPTVEFEDNIYMLIDSRDIMYVMNKEYYERIKIK